MKIVDAGKMLIITPDFGYTIHNIKDDSYHDIIYANKRINLEYLEEIEDGDVLYKLYSAVDDITQKNNEVVNIFRMLLNEEANK